MGKETKNHSTSNTCIHHNANESDNFSREIEVGQNNANKSDNFSREINVRTTVKDCKEWLDIHLSATGQPTGLLAIRL